VRVLVAGATGAIGRALVPKRDVRTAGAQAVVCDVFDVDAVNSAVGETGAEAVVHQLTALPDRLDFRNGELYSATNRLHAPEGTRVLLDAARGAGARRFVCQSIAFAYAPRGRAGEERGIRAAAERAGHLRRGRPRSRGDGAAGASGRGPREPDAALRLLL
jgi:nucleoside-diphosphate-sugar epimerase